MLRIYFTLFLYNIIIEPQFYEIKKKVKKMRSYYVVNI